LNWFVYIVRCSDGSLYTGISNDWHARLEAHNTGRGAKYTRSRRPVVLAKLERVGSKSEALKREYQLKSLSKAEKEKEVLYFGMGEYSTHFPDSSAARVRTVERFSWGIPNEEALRTILLFNPIVEMGAGTGYWAALLRDKGADIIAYDQAPPNIRTKRAIINLWHPGRYVFTKVIEGIPKSLKFHQDRTLFLCWPSLGSMTEQCLGFWKGEFLVFVGDRELCANQAFYEMIESEFLPVRIVRIPQWPAINDELVVWRRRQASPKT
jgi:putative endonuclease